MSKDAKLLIIGAAGFLGQKLCDLAGDDWVCVPTSRSGPRRVDLTQADEVEAAVLETKPRWVINAAAMTSVDGCERDPEQAYQVHVDGTRYLVRACEKAHCGLVTLSTNYVFDGQAGPYGEDDAPNPLNVYGQSKLAGEHLALQANCPSIVVRTAVLYGYQAGCRPNFVTWAMGALARDEAIRVVTDEAANPTYVDDLARFILSVCDASFEGLVHFGGRDFLTRFEMVMRICDFFDFDAKRVSPVTSAQFGQPARRPLRAGLRTELAADVSEIRAMLFDDSLVELKKHKMEIIGV